MLLLKRFGCGVSGVIWMANNTSNINNNREHVPIESRYALTVEEAAEYFRLGQKKIRCLAEDNPTAGLPFRMETDF